MFDRDMTKEELETQIIKTHGHYISVFNTEDQINNSDLVFKAIDLDSSNLSRISEKFYCKYYSELSSLLDENTYNYFPDFVYDLHHFYIAKYLEVKTCHLSNSFRWWFDDKTVICSFVSCNSTCYQILPLLSK